MTLNLSEHIESTADLVTRDPTSNAPDSTPYLSNYRDNTAIDPQQIVGDLLTATNGWPKKISDVLYVQKKGNEELYQINNKDELFAWLHQHFVVDWSDSKGRITKAEFLKLLEAMVESYKAIEFAPHWPLLPDTYYACPHDYPSVQGEALDEFINMFTPATEVDRELIKAFLLTLFWGGPTGQRPAFLITAIDDDQQRGRGVGKTTFVSLCGELCGGTLDVSSDEKVDSVKNRIFTQASGDSIPRIILRDNIKTHRLSDPGLESLITAPLISGHRMYRGNVSLPNYYIFALTINGAYASKDISQRVIVIQLQRPNHSTHWLSDVRNFINDNRCAIIGDILACLRNDGVDLNEHTTSRWGEWETGVLSRVSSPEHVRVVICERQHSIDDDDAEGAGFVEHLKLVPLYGHTNDVVRTFNNTQMQEHLQVYRDKKVAGNAVKKHIEHMNISKSVLWQTAPNGRSVIWHLQVDDETPSPSQSPASQHE